MSLALLAAAVVAVAILAGPSGRSILADRFIWAAESTRDRVLGRTPAPRAADSLAAAGDSADAAPEVVLTAAPEPRTAGTAGAPTVVGDPARAVWPQFRRGRTLFTPMGFVRVTVDKGAAEVFINGRHYGRTPYTVRLRTGEHAISLRASDTRYQPSRAQVFVARGDTSHIVFQAVD